jgi:Domain of unknown function (DUF4279)
VRVRQYVCFAISSPSIPPDAITGRLLLAPDEVKPKGSRIAGPPPVPQAHPWKLRSGRARASMMGEWTVEPDDSPPYARLGVLERGSVDDVRLEGDGVDVSLVVLLRSDERPDCLFGWRVPIWPVPAPNDPDDGDGTPEGDAFVLSVNLMELIDLPACLPAPDPDAQGITWIVN